MSTKYELKYETANGTKPVLADVFSPQENLRGKHMHIYLEIKDIRKVLLVFLENRLVTKCTYSPDMALKFTSIYKARKFIKENSLQDQFKPIELKF